MIEPASIVLLVGIGTLIIERIFSLSMYYGRRLRRMKCCGCTSIELRSPRNSDKEEESPEEESLE